MEYIGKLGIGKAGDEHHPISPLLLEKTKDALLNMVITGNDDDLWRYVHALRDKKVQREGLGLRKEIE